MLIFAVNVIIKTAESTAVFQFGKQGNIQLGHFDMLILVRGTLPLVILIPRSYRDPSKQ